MTTVIEISAFISLLIIAGVALVWNHKFDLKQGEMNPVVKRKYQ